MNCLIPGTNLKVLSRALQALSKIGDELYIITKEDRLSLITFNQTKTVCCRLNLLDTFFSSYQIEDNDYTCKIHMKSFLPLFRGNIDKKLDYVKLECDKTSDFMMIKMKYICDQILMINRLKLMEKETLSIGIEVDSGVNTLRTSSNTYNQLLTIFGATDDEITLEIEKNRILARNYCKGTPYRPKTMRSQTVWNSTEFDRFVIGKETTINFRLKPFKSAVHFADIFNLDVVLNFDVGGKPLGIIMNNPIFELHFIVATLNPDNATQTSSIFTSSVLTVDRNPSKNSSPAEDVEEDNRQKRAKYVFGRCFEETFNGVQTGTILAGNSDWD